MSPEDITFVAMGCVSSLDTYHCSGFCMIEGVDGGTSCAAAFFDVSLRNPTDERPTGALLRSGAMNLRGDIAACSGLRDRNDRQEAVGRGLA